MRALTVLGIETSCDETAAAVVRGTPPGPGRILSNVVHGQLADHAPYGGVVPEIAARAHVELIDRVVARALADAKIGLASVDVIAATAGPGLIGGVMVGLLTGKGLALATGKPLVAVNHLEAHALSGRLVAGTPFPFLLLLVSGGHCQLLAVVGPGRYTLYGSTVDDAVGEAYDKVAKLLRLPYPGGPQIEALARTGDSRRFSFPRPLLGREGADFSFSGLKTAVRQAITGLAAGRPPTAENAADLAASFQAAVLDVLADRVSNAMKRFRTEFGKGNAGFIVAGGVAANAAVRRSLAAEAGSRGFTVAFPPPHLCTDNAAMVAWAGIERISGGSADPLDVAPRARWPLAELGAPPAGQRRDPLSRQGS